MLVILTDGTATSVRKNMWTMSDLPAYAMLSETGDLVPLSSREATRLRENRNVVYKLTYHDPATGDGVALYTTGMSR